MEVTRGDRNVAAAGAQVPVFLRFDNQNWVFTDHIQTMSFSFKSGGVKTKPERVKPIPSPPRSRSSSIASDDSFASAVEKYHDDSNIAEPTRFPPEEEEQMVKSSHELKASANKQFAVKDYSSAISTYNKALAELPIYLDYELAVLQSNIAACHLQLREWKEAIDSAERGLQNLERELPMPKPENDKSKDKSGKQEEKASDNKTNSLSNDDREVIELPDDDDEEATAEALRKLNLSDQRKADILRIRTKLLLRRARAKVSICDEPAKTAAVDLNPDSDEPQQKSQKKSGIFENGSQWGNLSTALADYQTLSTPEYFRNLPSQDQKTVIEMLRSLPSRVETAKKKEVDEMLGKLKDLGNGILKPFGLSTDMFKMTQDPSTGGWSMNFGGQADAKK